MSPKSRSVLTVFAGIRLLLIWQGCCFPSRRFLSQVLLQPSDGHRPIQGIWYVHKEGWFDRWSPGQSAQDHHRPRAGDRVSHRRQSRHLARHDYKRWFELPLIKYIGSHIADSGGSVWANGWVSMEVPFWTTSVLTSLASKWMLRYTRSACKSSTNCFHLQYLIIAGSSKTTMNTRWLAKLRAKESLDAMARR